MSAHLTVFSQVVDVQAQTWTLFQVIKKGTKHKTFVRNGLKDVQSRIRKGERGIVVFAGDVTPVEVMCHLPAVCEEKVTKKCFFIFGTSAHEGAMPMMDLGI